ncbi:hypothetical protein SO694_00041231 [Aureococcus anophagefferens]|uniref:Uncharacterized protein n=1 Tax=Aureococcus anophagefferens TaxID=44056 RepID=A0ABR1G657_AURAN
MASLASIFAALETEYRHDASPGERRSSRRSRSSAARARPARGFAGGSRRRAARAAPLKRAAAAGPDAPGWALLGYGFVVERVVDECGRYGDGARRARPSARASSRRARVAAARRARERAYAKLLLVDATRGALPRAGGGAVVAALERRLGAPEVREPGGPEDARSAAKAAMTLNRLAEVAPHALALQFDALRDGARVIAPPRSALRRRRLASAALVLAVTRSAATRRSGGPSSRPSSRAPRGPRVARRRAAVATQRDLLGALGVLVARAGGGPPAVVSDAAARAAADAGPFCSPACDALRRALGLLLGVRAARRAAPPPPVEPCGAPAAPAGGLAALAAGDAAAAVLARCLGAAIAASRAVHGLWAPPLGAGARGDGVARLALAPAVDEIRAKTDPGGAALAASGGGLGTAAGLLRGARTATTRSVADGRASGRARRTAGAAARHAEAARALLALPGVGAAPVARLEDDLRAVAAHKDQKNAFHELAALALNAKPRADDGGGGPRGPRRRRPRAAASTRPRSAARRPRSSTSRATWPAPEARPAADGGGLGAPNLADLFKD